MTAALSLPRSLPHSLTLSLSHSLSLNLSLSAPQVLEFLKEKNTVKLIPKVSRAQLLGRRFVCGFPGGDAHGGTRTKLAPSGRPSFVCFVTARNAGVWWVSQEGLTGVTRGPHKRPFAPAADPRMSKGANAARVSAPHSNAARAAEGGPARLSSPGPPAPATRTLSPRPLPCLRGGPHQRTAAYRLGVRAGTRRPRPAGTSAALCCPGRRGATADGGIRVNATRMCSDYFRRRARGHLPVEVDRVYKSLLTRRVIGRLGPSRSDQVEGLGYRIRRVGLSGARWSALGLPPGPGVVSEPAVAAHATRRTREGIRPLIRHTGGRLVWWARAA